MTSHSGIASPAWVAEDQDRTPYHHAMLRLAGPVLLLAVFLAPYVVWRVLPPYLFTFSDALFCLAAVLLLAGRGIAVRPLQGWWAIWMLGLSGLLLGFFIGSLVNGDPLRWVIVAGQYGFAFALLPALLLRERRRSLVLAAIALVAGVAAMELFGSIVYYSTGGSYAQAKQFGFEFVTGAHRLGAFMADANWNAAMIAMTTPFVLYLARIRRMSTIAAFAILGILCSGLLLSGSFTGFASAAIGILAFLFLDWGKRSIGMLLGIVALASVMLATGVGLPTAFQNRVAVALEQGDINRAGTFSGRMELVKEAWEIVGDTTLVGLGVDQYRVVSVDRAPVHNIYLLAWAEGGVLSLLGWLIMMFVPLSIAVRRFAADRAAGALVIAVTLPFLIFSNAAPHMYARSWVVPLILALGIALTRPPASRVSARRS
ncbi:O-antigen ligase family protein [Sphingomonas sp.]|uniref:O-antigen ligase family protein n=1 Tax=Sphingomonas sp. TaxID=28214 RepID=UPI002ED9B134